MRVISFHHAELHKDGGQITGSQAMSDDEVYIIQSPAADVSFFRIPNNEREIGWKEILDRNEEQIIAESMDRALANFHFHPEHYFIFPLSDLINYTKKPLPGLSPAHSEQIIGKLWEGLYKNYFLGLKKENGDIVSPIGSTIPILFLSKTKEHLYVYLESADKTPFLLKQKL